MTPPDPAVPQWTGPSPSMPPSPASPVPPLPWWLPPAIAFLVALLSRWVLASYLFHSGQMPLGLAREASRMLKYDAIWHWYIAHHGYAKVEGHLQYADLITHYSWTWPKILSVSLLFGDSAPFAGIVLNCLVFSIASAVLARLAVVSGVSFWKPVAFLCCYPTAFFTNTVYNEPVFLLLTFSSMLLLVTGRPYAAFFLDAASLTIRVNAWANVAATTFTALRYRMPARRLALAAAALAASAAIQPLAIWHHRGSPTAHWEDFEKVQWMANPQPVPFKDPFLILRNAAVNPSVLVDDGFLYNSFWPSVSMFAAVIVLVVAWRFCPVPARVQGLATVMGLSLLEQAISTPRYLMAFVPMYFLAARAPAWVLGPVCVLMGWAQLHLVERFLRHTWAF
jgi:hypothetical protein